MSYANAVQGFIDSHFTTYQEGVSWLKQYFRNPGRSEDQRITALSQSLAVDNASDLEDHFIRFYFAHKMTPIKVVRNDGTEFSVPRKFLTKETKAHLRPGEKIELQALKELSVESGDSSQYVRIHINNISTSSIEQLKELLGIFKNVELVFQESCSSTNYKKLFELPDPLSNVKSIRFMIAFDFFETKFLQFLRENRSIDSISLVKVSELEGAALLMALDERKVLTGLTIAGVGNFPIKWQLALISRDPKFLKGLTHIVAELAPHDAQVHDLYVKLQTATAPIKPRVALKLHYEFDAIVSGVVLSRSIKAVQAYKKFLLQFPSLNKPFYVYPVRYLDGNFSQWSPYIIDQKLAHAYSLLWEMGGPSYGITCFKHGFENLAVFIQTGKLKSEKFDDVHDSLNCAHNLYLGLDILDTCREIIIKEIEQATDVILLKKYVYGTLLMKDKVLERFFRKEHSVIFNTTVVNKTQFVFEFFMVWSINRAYKYDIKIEDLNCTALIVLEEFLKDESLGSLTINGDAEPTALETLTERLKQQERATPKVIFTAHK